MEILSSQHSSDIITFLKGNIFDYTNNIDDLLAILQHIRKVCIIQPNDNIVDKVFKLYLSTNGCKEFTKAIARYDLRMLNYGHPIRLSKDMANNILFYLKASDKTLTILAKTKMTKPKRVRDYITHQIDGLISDYDNFNIIDGFANYLITYYPDEYAGEFREYHEMLKALDGQM